MGNNRNNNIQSPPKYCLYRLTKTLKPPSTSHSCVKFSNNDKLLATSSLDESLIVWSTETLTLISHLIDHSNGVSDLTWSSDSHYICFASDGRTLRILDAFSGECVKTPLAMSKSFRSSSGGGPMRRIASDTSWYEISFDISNTMFDTFDTSFYTFDTSDASCYEIRSDTSLYQTS